MKYAGTTLSGGQPVNSSICVEGFDTAAFAVGSAEMAINLCEYFLGIAKDLG